MKSSRQISRIETQLSFLCQPFRCLAICLLATNLCVAAESPALIPVDQINALKNELVAGANEASSVATRRACKGVVREAEELLAESPDAPNRFAVLDIMFAAARRLLSLAPTEENREMLFGIAEQVQSAPDEYAETRLEADFMLSERDLAAADAKVSERVEALEQIIEKYRGTDAERRSLVIASMIAEKLQAFDLYDEIQERMAGGALAGDHKSIVFIRAAHSPARQNVVFSGTYKTVKGNSITFPWDRLGHQYLVILWSKESGDYEAFLSQVKEQQERFPGRFETYSLNLDELPDAGSSILARAGVKAKALQLPEGRSSSTYKAYGLMDPIALLVNGQGYLVLQKGRVVPWPDPIREGPGPGAGLFLDDSRYLSQLRSLFIGDWLVKDAEREQADLEAIDNCFVMPPFRYRLTPEEELANYHKAEKLSSDLIRKDPKGGNVLELRNYRIVALMGMWNLEREPEYLEEAVKEAQSVLSMELPAGKTVVVRFCLAIEQLRNGETDLEALLRELAGAEPSAGSLSAAAVLAIQASAEDLYKEYRGRFIDRCNEDDSSLWLPLSFMRDRQHNYRLFWANPGKWGFTRKQRYYAKYIISGLWGVAETGRLFQATLEGLDGQKLSFPEETKGDMIGIIFAELPSDDSDRDKLMGVLRKYAGQFMTNGVPVTVAFLSDDTNEVAAAVGDGPVTFRPAVLPGGLRNPMVRRLGILSADRIPNPYLLKGDGTIAWSISGLSYAMESPFKLTGSVADEVTDAIGVNIEKVRTDRAFDALDKGEFKKALSLFDERLPPKMSKDAWTHDRLHGVALAHMGLKDWQAALTAIDMALARQGSVTRWGRDTDAGFAEMHCVRAAVLRKLDRQEEAAEAAAFAAKVEDWLKTAPFFYPPSYARGGIPVGVYTDLLRRVRLQIEGAGKGK